MKDEGTNEDRKEIDQSGFVPSSPRVYESPAKTYVVFKDHLFQRDNVQVPMVKWETYAHLLDAYTKLLGAYTSLLEGKGHGYAEED